MVKHTCEDKDNDPFLHPVFPYICRCVQHFPATCLKPCLPFLFCSFVLCLLYLIFFFNFFAVFSFFSDFSVCLFFAFVLFGWFLLPPPPSLFFFFLTGVFVFFTGGGWGELVVCLVFFNLGCLQADDSTFISPLFSFSCLLTDLYIYIVHIFIYCLFFACLYSFLFFFHPFLFQTFLFLGGGRFFVCFCVVVVVFVCVCV